MAGVKEKSVGFFQVGILSEAQRRTPVVDWIAVLTEVAGRPMSERIHGGVVYDPHIEDGVALVGVHALLKPDFMTSIDSAGARITDLMDSAEASGLSRLAHSTALYFLPVGNAVAVATGTNNSPKPPKVITEFLTLNVPLPSGASWTATPIMDTDKVRRFRDESQGAASFDTRISTVRSVFEPDETQGIARFADQIAERIGGDVTIDISVRVAPQSRSRSVTQRFRDLIISDLPRVLANPGSRTKVNALLPDGVEEEMNLVAARLAATIEVDTSVSESLRFSALMTHLRDVGAEMEDHVRQLLEG